MSRSRPRSRDDAESGPPLTMWFVCTHKTRGGELRKETLKTLKVSPGRFGRGVVRTFIYGAPDAKIRNGRIVKDGWILIGLAEHLASDPPPDGYVEYLNEPCEPSLFDFDGGDDSNDVDVARNGLERVRRVAPNGLFYSYLKLRLNCPHCPLDETLDPIGADQMVRHFAKRGRREVELREVSMYIQGQ